MKEVLLVNLTNKWSVNKEKLTKKKLAKAGMSYNSDITERSFKSIELSIKDRGWKVSERKYIKVFGRFAYLVTKIALVLQALLSQAKRKAVEELPTSLSL